MGIRETLNKNPSITTGVTAGIVILALIIIIYEVVGGGNSAPKPPTKAYYTITDGLDYFADDINLLAPYDKDGKQAVRCYVFKTSTAKPFVAYLEKYTPEAKKMIEASRSKPAGPNNDPMIAEQAMATGTLVKKPGTGEKGWVKQNMPGSEKVTEIHPPDNSSLETLEPVMP